MSFINDFSLKEFCDFAILAIKKESEDRIERQWLAMLPNMVKYVRFEEFRDLVTGANIDLRPVDEIIAEIDAKHKQANME